MALSLTAVLAGVAGGAIVAATDDNSSSASVPAASTSPAPVASTGGDISKAVSTIGPSVVNITAEISGGSGRFGGGFQGQGGGTSAGTGIIVTSDGQVVTNAHVVAGATAITVQVPGHKDKVSATVIGSDSNADLALLQLKDVSGLAAATFAASSTVNVGDSVLAVGNAEGYGGSPTVTLGIVSATNRSLSGSSSDSGSSLTGLIQTDAAINPGNSGGPLVDTAGRVIGINTEVATGSDTSRAAQNIGFAIPSDKVLAELPKLRAGGGSSTSDSGGAYLGVSVQDGTGSTSGAVIAQVVPGGPAANAGLQAGDVVTAVGNTQLGSADDLQAAIAGHKAGDKVTLTVTRDGQQHTVTVELGSRSDATTQ
ncbi:MAG: S1C family serine protease [Frankiaceae bacterium]